MVNQNISRTYGKTFEKGSPNSNDELFSLTYRSKQKSRSLQAKPIECLKKKKINSVFGITVKGSRGEFV